MSGSSRLSPAKQPTNPAMCDRFTRLDLDSVLSDQNDKEDSRQEKKPSDFPPHAPETSDSRAIT